MRVTVTELKKMIAESVAKHMKEDAPPTAAAVPLRQRMGSRVPGRPEEMQTGGVGGKPEGMNKAPTSSAPASVNELRSMVREVIEEMMHKKEEKLDETEKLKEAVRRMVREALKKSGK